MLKQLSKKKRFFKFDTFTRILEYYENENKGQPMIGRIEVQSIEIDSNDKNQIIFKGSDFSSPLVIEKNTVNYGYGSADELISFLKMHLPHIQVTFNSMPKFYKQNINEDELKQQLLIDFKLNAKTSFDDLKFENSDQVFDGCNISKIEQKLQMTLQHPKLTVVDVDSQPQECYQFNNSNLPDNSDIQYLISELEKIIIENAKFKKVNQPRIVSKWDITLSKDETNPVFLDAASDVTINQFLLYMFIKPLKIERDITVYYNDSIQYTKKDILKLYIGMAERDENDKWLFNDSSTDTYGSLRFSTNKSTQTKFSLIIAPIQEDDYIDENYQKINPSDTKINVLKENCLFMSREDTALVAKYLNNTFTISDRIKTEISSNISEILEQHNRPKSIRFIFNKVDLQGR